MARAEENKNRRGEGVGLTKHSVIADESSVDIFDFSGALTVIVDAVRYHKLVIAMVTLMVLSLALLYHWAWPPTYKAEAVITVEPTTDAQRDEFYKEWNLFRKPDGRTEIELMTSSTVLKEVIKRQSLRYEDVYHPFFAQISYFWKKSWLGKKYKDFKGWLFGESELDKLTPEEKELALTVRDLRSGFSVQIAGDVLAATVYAKGPSPKIADITNTFLDVYQEWRTEQQLTEAKQALQTLDGQMLKQQQELDRISAERVDFLNRHQLVFDFSKETQEVEELVKLESDIAETEIHISNLRASLAEIDLQLQSEPSVKVINKVDELNTVREAARIKHIEAEAELIKQRIRYKEDSPEVAEIKTNLASLQHLIDGSPEQLAKSTQHGLNTVRESLLAKRSNTRTELAGLEAAVVKMHKLAEEMRARHQAVPQLTEQLRDLDRAYQVAQEVYALLSTKRAQAAVSVSVATNATSSYRVVDYAARPASKSWPKARYLYPLALIFGLVLGVFSAVVKNILNGRVYSRHLIDGVAEYPLHATLAMNVAKRGEGAFRVLYAKGAESV
ncbi:MAG: Wzz/FepE/Etk N-terminal domain-containing protein [Chromatiales bacterium]|nr:Wzz/FepE/Etk N-terminal domain-containing protein [Chromatiales bacterium]